MDLEHSLRCTICSSTKIPCDCKYLSGLQYPPPSRKDILLQEATALLTRYRDALLVDASKRPTSKEVNAFLEKCK